MDPCASPSYPPPEPPEYLVEYRRLFESEREEPWAEEVGADELG